MKSLAGSFQFSQNLNERTKRKSLIIPLLALAAGLVLATNPAQAQNLLQNPGFESPPPGQTVPLNWTYFAPPTLGAGVKDYWVVYTNSVGCSHMHPHSGTYYWKEWGALNNGTTNVAGLYQAFSSTPGSIYQASGWLSTSTCDELGSDCVTWIQVEFLDVNTNVLALYKSANFSASAGADTWFQYQVTNRCDLTQPVATGDPNFTTYAVTGSVSQLVAPFGTTQVRYRYCYLQGTGGGSAFLDDTVLNQVSGPVPPVINNLFPQNMILVDPSNSISFNVSSPSGFTINNSGIQLVLNGTNVSGSLAISGSASSKNVAYSGLQSNSTYTVSISVTDVSNLTVTASTYFETMWFGIQPVTYLWEAEDWDFNSGMYIDVPDLCNAPGDPNCYFGKVGVEGVDEHYVSGVSGGAYRPSDPIGTAPSGDYSRPNLFDADRVDYCVNPFVSTSWVNYTRDWPNSTNWIIARLATDVGYSGSITLSVLTPETTNTLGTFTINSGLGWTHFEYVYLQDTNGHNANVILNGKETLQLAAIPASNPLPTFFMLVAAEVDLPLLSNLYPTGKQPFEPTNALSFTVTTSGATFPANGIKVILDGNDVSSALLITGSASTKNVDYPTLQLNAVHTAIITVTNSLGHGISVTNQFDTFSQTNYMFEAEDFDYSGGHYVSASDYLPGAYYGSVSVTNIDFQHTYVSGEPTNGTEYQYRPNGIPQEPTYDYLRQIFIDNFTIDYMLYWFGASDWANYTRVYPTGNYYVYARSAGLGAYSMYLDQVVSGAGTTNQVTKSLGQWGAVGNSIQANAWVLLTDNGLVAPVVVNVGGTNTLRVSTTTGDCYPNFFMLVQASGIRLSAARTGSNVVVSFQTQSGSNYRVFYRTNLSTGNWTLLNTVLGDSTIKSVSDSSAAGNQRFYKMTSP